ncbi:response regulator [Sandarakinorhabdus sp.]|jgi:CheY-like chemotaxis protein|uniref:response regulator n=1 Tax=Sandarakinorhabdus sp. TaxID=1916663 RepID=UPI0028AEC26C|nr:response regulator [Sandarakinorhabdus sp.]
MMMPPASSIPRILIVEDSIFIGLALQDMCDSLGWALIGPAVTIADGMRLARTESIDAALLDVEIGDSQSWDIATVLQQRAIPFAFTTGHALAGILPARFAATPILRKPFRMAGIEQLIGSLLAAPASPPPA